MVLSPRTTRGRRFTIGRLMFAVAILAIGFKLYATIGVGAGNAMAALMLLVLAARTIVANPAGSLPRRRAIAWTGACLAVYVPCVQGFFMDCSHCVGVWAQLWPIVPGGVPSYLVLSRTGLQQLRSDTVNWLLSGAFTLALIATIAAVGLRGKWWMWSSLAAGALYSALAALGIAAAIRA